MNHIYQPGERIRWGAATPRAVCVVRDHGFAYSHEHEDRHEPIAVTWCRLLVQVGAEPTTGPATCTHCELAQAQG